MQQGNSHYPIPIFTPNGKTAQYQLLPNGVKRFHLIAEPVVHEIVGGVKIKGWGYNGSIPGPTIVVNQGDYVQIIVENRLPNDTSVHWHGLIVSNKMDGVPGPGGSPIIKPGESFTYEFYMHQAGTFMYHSHVNNAIQELMGLSGMFIVRGKQQEPVQRDFVLLLQEWAVKTESEPDSMNIGANQQSGSKKQNGMQQSNMKMGIMPGTYEIDPEAMTYNYFTINGKAYPDTEPLFVRYGEKVRLRLGNLSMDSHPMHFHGHDVIVIAADGNTIPTYSRMKKNTINVAPGETWDIEFFANNPGNWVFHCHKPHHTTNAHSKGIGGMLTLVRYAK
ncbi:multicopper oxidase family protein [Bacillota bacterium Lsc_1132]